MKHDEKTLEEPKITVTTDIRKKDNGHDIFINDHWVMWCVNSKRNAQKELDKYLLKNNYKSL